MLENFFSKLRQDYYEKHTFDVEYVTGKSLAFNKKYQCRYFVNKATLIHKHSWLDEQQNHCFAFWYKILQVAYYFIYKIRC